MSNPARILLTALFMAQAASAPSFEVASINPHPPGRGIIIARRGPAKGGESGGIGRRQPVTINTCSLKLLIMLAYDAKDFQIIGVPAGAGKAPSEFWLPSQELPKPRHFPAFP
jgi:hypothetical protein